MRVATVLLTICTAVFSCRAVGAEVITFKMTGTVMVSDPTFVLPADVVTGAAFTAFLTYDTSVPDSLLDDPQEGRYHLDHTGTEFGLFLSIGSLLLYNDPTDDFVIEVLDDTPLLPGFSPPSDSMRLRSVRSIGGPSNLGSLLQPSLSLIWDNPDQDSWDSDALPTDLNPSGLRRAEVVASGPDEQPPLGRPYDITAFVTQVTVVPEPSGLLLFAAGIVVLLPRFIFG